HLGAAAGGGPGCVPAGGVANRGQVTEIEGRGNQERRLRDGRKDDIVARYAVVTDTVTAAHDCLLISEDIIREAEGRAVLDAAVLEAAALEALRCLLHAVEGIT